MNLPLDEMHRNAVAHICLYDIFSTSFFRGSDDLPLDETHRNAVAHICLYDILSTSFFRGSDEISY